MFSGRAPKYCPIHQQCSHNWYECRLNPVNGGNAPVDNQGRYAGPPPGQGQNGGNRGPPNHQNQQAGGNQQANGPANQGPPNNQSRKRPFF